MPRLSARAASLVGTLALSLGLSPGSASPATLPGGAISEAHEGLARLSQQGRWLTDDTGRVVMLRGGNVIELLDTPGAPDHDGRALDPKTPTQMAAAGFDAVRLAIFMSRLAPTPEGLDFGYLEAVAATVAAYERAGVYVLLDFHQDEFGPSIGVRGMPGWMALTDGHAPDRSLAFPNGYFRDPAVQTAFDNFWANKEVHPGLTVQEAYISVAVATATRFAHDPGVFGIDLMNEPATGTPCSQPDPRSADCPNLERDRLQPFYQKAGTALWRVAPRTILFFEPFMLQGALGIPIHTPIPAGGLRGLSFHNYGPFRPLREKVSTAALECAAESGAAILNTEWGFNNDAAELSSQADDFDARLIPWIAWARGPFEELVNTNEASTADGTLVTVLRAYARPYPSATAGTPDLLRFDQVTGTFEYRWSTVGLNGDRASGATLIRMPPLQFPHGYRVRVQGGQVTSLPNATVLVVRASRGVGEVAVRAERIGTLPGASGSATEKPQANELSVNSLVGDLMRDPGARAILEREIPALAKSGQIGLASQASLRSMQPYIPELTDQKLAEIDVALKALHDH